ncbi:MAG: DUF4397 domain-containing protein [Chitinophagaceae bacterium]|nr:DUF4397 domain-containing protein [Chitinophagaceae bacterium]
MKKISLNILTLALIFALGSCDKKAEPIAILDYGDANATFLKINYLSAYPANPNVQLSINGTRVSGLITGRTPFPGGGYNTNGSNFPDYLKLTPGATALSVAIPKLNTNTDSIVLFTTSLSLASGKHYTAHVTDTGVNTKAVLIEDNLSFNDTTSRYRFANMMPNVPSIDLYYGTTLVSSGIPYLGYSNYFDIPVPATAQTWAIRETGTLPTSTALATYSSTNTSLRNRVYTVFALGYKGQTATATKPYVSFLLNK